MSDRPVARITSGRLSSTAPDMREISGFVSTSEAAAELGVNEQAIRRAIQRGDLIATKRGRSYRISRAALDEFRGAHGEPYRTRPLLRLVQPIADDVETTSAGPAPVPLVVPEQIARTALPSPLTPFFGRTREIAALTTLLLREEVRLVTLTGPGGVGKTRLALEVARAVSPDFADGVAFVALAAVRDPDLVASAVVQAVGLMESDYLPAAERLTAALRDRRLLLLLDNFEHVAAAGSLVTDLLRSCPQVTILITSRALLSLTGEHAFVVPPLALPARGADRPDTATLPAPDELGQIEAVQLFVSRAQAAWPEFTLTAENAPAVAAICARVDGLPLAIELAAARSAALSPPALLARLERRLSLLTGGPRDQVNRLRTMRDAIAWSYDLLDPATRDCFRRLAVFSGGCTVEGAEAVAGATRPEEREGSSGHVPSALPHLNDVSAPSPTSVLDALMVLVTSSLIQRRDLPDGEPRFSMLETVREFALEELRRSGEEDATHAAHAAYYLDLLEQAQPALWAATKPELLDRIETEHDNLRLALTWTFAHDQELTLRLASALGLYWSKRSYWSEGRGWLERALRTGAGAGTAARAAALVRLGAIDGDQGDYAEARRSLEESLALADRLGDGQIAARARRGLGILASNRSEFAEAAGLFAQALERFRSLDDQIGVARCLNDLGLVAERQGDQLRAIAYQEEALPIARAAGDDWQVCIILGNLGGAHYDRGDFARGEALTREALELARQLGDTFGIAVNCYNLGNCVLELGDPAGAIERYRETLSLTRDLGERHLASRTLDRLGIALHQTGASRPAPRLFGAAAALRESVGDTLFSQEDRNLARRFHDVRDALGEATYTAAWESGRMVPFEQAIAEGMALADAALTAQRAARSRDLAGLTVREFEVLCLLADGQADKDIAERLYISPRTASSHVAAIIAKLGVDSRTAAVAMALRNGLI